MVPVLHLIHHQQSPHLYIKNSCDTFRLFEIKDRQLQKKIESIINLPLYCQTLLSGHSSFFYDDYDGVSQASVMEIFNCKLCIEKYFLQVYEVPNIVSQLSGSGVEIPYSMIQWQQMPFPASQSMIDVQLNVSQFQNLERIMIMCRRTGHKR